jgi:hypothetical protein
LSRRTWRAVIPSTTEKVRQALSALSLNPQRNAAAAVGLRMVEIDRLGQSSAARWSRAPRAVCGLRIPAGGRAGLI